MRTVDAKYTVVFNEKEKRSFFKAIHGQDVSMAAAKDPRDYRSIDLRRTEGPIPFQCRTRDLWNLLVWSFKREGKSESDQ